MVARFMRPHFYISLQRTISISISRALNGLQLLVSLVNTRPSDIHDWRTLRASSRALRAASFAQLGVFFFSGYFMCPAALNAAPRAARIARKTRVVGLPKAHTSTRPTHRQPRQREVSAQADHVTHRAGPGRSLRDAAHLGDHHDHAKNQPGRVAPSLNVAVDVLCLQRAPMERSICRMGMEHTHDGMQVLVEPICSIEE